MDSKHTLEIAMSATVEKPTYPKLTPEEFQELLQRERAKGNPLALIAGSAIDPDDPDDKDFWRAIHEHRDRMEQQLREIEERETQQCRNDA